MQLKSSKYQDFVSQKCPIKIHFFTIPTSRAHNTKSNNFQRYRTASSKTYFLLRMGKFSTGTLSSWDEIFFNKNEELFKKNHKKEWFWNMCFLEGTRLYVIAILRIPQSSNDTKRAITTINCLEKDGCCDDTSISHDCFSVGFGQC